MDWVLAGQGQVVGVGKHGNKPSGFIKCRGFPFHLEKR